MFTLLIEKLEFLSDKYKILISESLYSLDFEGKGIESAMLAGINEVNDALITLNSQHCFSIFIDKEKTKLEDLTDYVGTEASWRIHINKQRLVSKDNCICLFFYDLESFRHWADSINPFSNDNLFNSNKCCIQVNKLGCSIVGENFIISEVLDSVPVGGNDVLDNKILTHLRNYDISKVIKPSKHIIVAADANCISELFYERAIHVMLSALCDEMYTDKVILNGVRRMDLNLKGGRHTISGDIVGVHNLLRDVLDWVYLTDERQELRHKLLIDRLTLDISLSEDYYSGALKVIRYAYEQAKERYSYAIYDRANQYQKELKEVLKDLKTIGEAYSSKLRNIINHFSRDFLAALLTIGITLFSRYNDLNNLSSLGVLEYVFTAFAIYLIISIVIQVSSDVSDLKATEREFDYWKKVTREYMSNNDFDTHKENTIGKRKTKFWCHYAIVLILYLGLALFAFKAQTIWEILTDKDDKKETPVLYKYDTVSRDTDTTMHCPQSGK